MSATILSPNQNKNLTVVTPQAQDLIQGHFLTHQELEQPMSFCLTAFSLSACSQYHL